MEKSMKRIAAGVLAALILIVIGYFIVSGIKGRPENKKVQTLIEGYYKALETGDEETLKTLIADPENGEALIRTSEMVESYESIECSTYSGINKDEFITFVEYKMKFNNIGTPASSLSAFYIIPAEEGRLQILTCELSQEQKDAMLKIGSSKEVEMLKTKVDQNLKEEISSDEELKNFFMIISGK